MRTKFLLTVAVALIGWTDMASAADLPARTYTKAPVMPEVFNWTGFYIGANGGGMWTHNDVTSAFFDGAAIPSAQTLAGLAGIIEVAGPIGHLQPSISPGYGFTAIIVAFLGRLNPVGILIAGLFLALTFIGGEEAQISMKVPLDLTKVFQGILLFYVLACDSLIVYRIRLVRTLRKPVAAHA